MRGVSTPAHLILFRQPIGGAWCKTVEHKLYEKSRQEEKQNIGDDSKTSEIFRKTSEIFRKTLDFFPKTWEIFWEMSEIFSRQSDILIYTLVDACHKTPKRQSFLLDIRKLCLQFDWHSASVQGTMKLVFEVLAPYTIPFVQLTLLVIAAVAQWPTPPSSSNSR